MARYLDLYYRGILNLSLSETKAGRQATCYREEDDRFCLNKSKGAVLKHDCELHGFVLMTHHAHLRITPYQENAIAKVRQMPGRVLCPVYPFGL
jgi:putative transposase